MTDKNDFEDKVREIARVSYLWGANSHSNIVLNHSPSIHERARRYANTIRVPKPPTSGSFDWEEHKAILDEKMEKLRQSIEEEALLQKAITEARLDVAQALRDIVREGKGDA